MRCVLIILLLAGCSPKTSEPKHKDRDESVGAVSSSASSQTTQSSAVSASSAVSRSSSVSSSIPSQQSWSAEKLSSLSPAARALLGKFMKFHLVNAQELMHASVELDYPAIIYYGSEMLKEPVSDLEAEDNEALGSELPRAFWSLRQKLHGELKSLMSAAQSKDAASVSQAFGRVIHTCMSCHASFR